MLGAAAALMLVTAGSHLMLNGTITAGLLVAGTGFVTMGANVLVSERRTRDSTE